MVVVFLQKGRLLDQNLTSHTTSRNLPQTRAGEYLEPGGRVLGRPAIRWRFLQSIGRLDPPPLNREMRPGLSVRTDYGRFLRVRTSRPLNRGAQRRTVWRFSAPSAISLPRLPMVVLRGIALPCSCRASPLGAPSGAGPGPSVLVALIHFFRTCGISHQRPNVLSTFQPWQRPPVSTERSRQCLFVTG